MKWKKNRLFTWDTTSCGSFYETKLTPGMTNLFFTLSMVNFLSAGCLVLAPPTHAGDGIFSEFLKRFQLFLGYFLWYCWVCFVWKWWWSVWTPFVIINSQTKTWNFLFKLSTFLFMSLLGVVNIGAAVVHLFHHRQLDCINSETRRMSSLM